MRFVAKYALTSRANAIIATAISAAIPMFFWVAAAVVGLITLRRGSREGSQVMLWGSLPAVFWLSQGDPIPVAVILGVMLMALILRATVNWSKPLLAGAVLGAALSSIWPPQLVAEIVNVLHSLAVAAGEGDASLSNQQEEFLTLVVMGAISAFYTVAVFGSLVLARWWQAVEFNPGGFQKEFHQFRLPLIPALVLGAVVFLSAEIDIEALKWVPALSIPLVFACIALVHGVVAIKQLSSTWLTVFYVLLFIMGHSLYVFMIFMAFLDSFWDFRGRLVNQKPPQD